jgi:predicted transcriptional regulator of viral defense system
VANALSRLAAEGRSIFHLADLTAATGWSRRRAVNSLHQLRRSGWIVSLARGTYLIVPLEAGPDAAWTEDALVIASHLVEPGAAAYWSACHYWNWTEQVPRTVFVQTPQRTGKKRRQVLGITYEFVRVTDRKFFGTLERQAGQGRVVVTDREKTLVDALDRPDLCGGMRQVAEMLPEAARGVRWETVEAYLEKMGSGALYKRLGFLVETLGEKARVPEREWRLERWRAHLTGGHAPLEPGGPAEGPVNARWRVRVNVSAMAGEEGRG